MAIKVNAGEFSSWIEEFTRTMKGVGEGSVPCGECVGCCTSSKFIHIRPTDKDAINVITKELMFQAPRRKQDTQPFQPNEHQFPERILIRSQ